MLFIFTVPNIPDTGSQTELLKATSENASFDDNESESDENALGLTGVPGYEHSEHYGYVKSIH